MDGIECLTVQKSPFLEGYPAWQEQDAGDRPVPTVRWPAEDLSVVPVELEVVLALGGAGRGRLGNGAGVDAGGEQLRAEPGGVLESVGGRAPFGVELALERACSPPVRLERAVEPVGPFAGLVPRAFELRRACERLVGSGGVRRGPFLGSREADVPLGEPLAQRSDLALVVRGRLGARLSRGLESTLGLVRPRPRPRPLGVALGGVPVGGELVLSREPPELVGRRRSARSRAPEGRRTPRAHRSVRREARRHAPRAHRRARAPARARDRSRRRRSPPAGVAHRRRPRARPLRARRRRPRRRPPRSPRRRAPPSPRSAPG